MNKEKKNSRVVMLIIDALIAAVLLALDQFTKYLAVVHRSVGVAISGE